jgi:signal transduction histidine kinase
VKRGAGQLRSALARHLVAHLALAESNLTTEQVHVLRRLDQGAQQQARRPDSLDALTRSDRENELEGWLEEAGLDQVWELAPDLVSLGYDREELTRLASGFTPAQLSPMLTWLISCFTIYNVLDEIDEGAGRMVEIVKALKTYTYLDQAPVQNVNVHEGLENTLVMLRSKLKQGVTVHRQYAADLPLIEAYGSELNQVWTNIIDNAIGAMAGQGEITLRTRQQDQWVVVEIEDNGPGVPESIQGQIFDPFFTTKPPGEGTGLGLNISHNIIVQKHKGKISVRSQPGQTCFQIKLPLTIDVASD